MFLRILLLCATVSIFLNYILAVPFPLKPQATGDSPTTSPGQVTKKSLNESESFEKKTKQFSDNFFRLHRSNRAVLHNWVHWIFLTAGLGLEFEMMADGSHYKFPLSEKKETDQQHKTISIAVCKLLMNLKTLVRAHHVVGNVNSDLDTELFFRFDFSQKSEEVRKRTLLQDYFRILNYQMETDKELGNEYKKRLHEAREFVKKNPEMGGPLMIKVPEEYSRTGNLSLIIDDVLKLLEDKKTFRRSAFNDLFFEYSNERIVKSSNSSDHNLMKHYALAKALIQKAAAISSSESKVNDIYQRALIEAEEEWTNEGVEGILASKGDLLFDALEKALKSDPVLYEEVENLKEQIVKNAVEK